MRYETREEIERIGAVGAKLVRDDFGLRARYLSSFWLYIEEDDQAFSPHWRGGTWESWVSCWLSKQWHRTDLFLDVGANVGYFTMQAARAGVVTIPVEPNPKLAAMIMLSRNANRLQELATPVWEMALSDYNGKATLWVPEGHSGGASLRDSAEGFEVEVKRLDDHFNSWLTHRMLIKIDAEGEEPKIWAGMQKTFRDHICQVLLEWHGVRYDREAFADELFRHDVYLIDYEGNEQPTTREWLVSTNDLHMILVRPKKENLDG